MPLRVDALRGGIQSQMDAGRDQALGEGLRLLAQGDPQAALYRFRQAHGSDPLSADAPAAMGYALGLLARHREAAVCYREALRLDPRHPAALCNLGDLLRGEGRLGEAAGLLELAIATHPGLAEAASNLALVRQAEGRLAEAAALAERAVGSAPGFAAAWANLASIRADLGEPDRAAAAARRAIGLEPASAAGHWNLGLAERMAGRIAASIACHRRATALAPASAAPHWNLALSLLAAGQWREGWVEWEWRFAAGRAAPLPADPEPWTGQPPRGGTILVRSEQGLGDTIQFLRYLRLLEGAGARIALALPAPLDSLLSASGLAQPASRASDAAWQVSLGSLPAICQTRICSTPSPGPYLKPDAAGAARWAAWLERLPRPRIGLCWRGNPANPTDRFRSLPGQAAAEIAAFPGASFVSLQAGYDPPPGAIRPPENSISDLAAIVANLDLVISADTMIAHLAGALGIPVWIALSSYADWRWLTRRTCSPWYASARLFRQPRLGAWDHVVADLRSALEIHFGRSGFGRAERSDHPRPAASLTQQLP